MLSCGSPSTVLQPASTTNILTRSATTVERRPMRSAASRMCGTAKRAPASRPGAEEVGSGRTPLPGGQYGELAVHLVFPHLMALQGGTTPFDF